MEVHSKARQRRLYDYIFHLLIVFIYVNSVHSTTSGYYADNGVDQTEQVHEMNSRDKRELQHEILTLLGLHQRPKPHGINTMYSAPKFMVNLYNSITSDNGLVVDINEKAFHVHHNITLGDSFVQPVDGTDVIMSFVNRANKVVHLRHDRDRTFYFDFSKVMAKETVIASELRIYKEDAKKWKNHLFDVQIHLIKQGQDPEDKNLELVSSIPVPADYNGWLTLNLTTVASMWTAMPETNLGLYMKIISRRKGREVPPKKFGIVGRKGADDKQPFMVGFFSSDQELLVRHTRTAIRRHRQEFSYREETEKYLKPQRRKRAVPKIWPCQRQSLYVRFRDLGWGKWIIAPSGYQAFFCEGECSFPLGSSINATNHAIVQNLVHLLNPYEAPSPGCAPTKLGKQSVLYFDDNSNVVLKKFSKMVVKACGCH